MATSRQKLTRLAGVGLIGLALTLAGCGVRGGLETPRESTEAQPTSATAEAGQGKPEGATRKPHKGFILDGLLR